MFLHFSLKDLNGLGSGFRLGLRLGVGLVLLALAFHFNYDAALGLLAADHPGVNHLGAVAHHLLDQSLLHQFSQSPPGEGSTNLQPGDDGGCDEVVGGDLLVQLVVGALVTPHQVVQLVPGLSLGPLLLLGPLMATMVTSVLGWLE